MKPQTLTCSSLYRPANPAISASAARFRHPSALFPRSPGKPFKNNIRSACGTPVDSGRFRQAVNIRKKKCADKYCRIDCQSLHAVCLSHCSGRTHPCDSGGLLHGPAFRHQHRHQHADFAQSRLAQARQPVRRGVRPGPDHSGRGRGADAGTDQHGRQGARRETVGRHRAISNRCSRSAPASSSKRTGCCSCRWRRSAS